MALATKKCTPAGWHPCSHVNSVKLADTGYLHEQAVCYMSLRLIGSTKWESTSPASAFKGCLVRAQGTPFNFATRGNTTPAQLS